MLGADLLDARVGRGPGHRLDLARELHPVVVEREPPARDPIGQMDRSRGGADVDEKARHPRRVKTRDHLVELPLGDGRFDPEPRRAIEHEDVGRGHDQHVHAPDPNDAHAELLGKLGGGGAEGVPPVGPLDPLERDDVVAGQARGRHAI